MSVVKNIEIENQNYDIYGKNIQPITWQEYEAIEDKNDDKAYFITDVPPSEQKKTAVKPLPTGAISTVSDAAPLPLNALKVSVEAWQEGSGDPSPSNVRPIHGWDSGEITVVGKNLWDISSGWDRGYISSADSEIDITVRNSGETLAYSLQKFIKGGDYIFSATTNGTYARLFIRIRKSDDSGWETNTNYSISGWSYNSYYDGWYKDINTSGAISISFTVPECKYWQFGVGANSATSVGVGNTFTFANPQLELGTTATTYEPYQGKQYTQQFPQTIYGAEWDVVGGSGNNTYGVVVIDGSTNVVSNGAAIGNIYRCEWQGARSIGAPLNDYMSDRFKSVKESDSAPWTIYASTSTTATRMFFAFPGDTFSSVTNCNAWFAEHPTQVVYKLATPTTIQLSPLSIRFLEGTNNVYADCGEVIEGEYFGNNTNQIRVNDEIIAGGNSVTFAAESKYAEHADIADNACTFSVDENGLLTISLVSGDSNNSLSSTRSVKSTTTLPPEEEITNEKSEEEEIKDESAEEPVEEESEIVEEKTDETEEEPSENESEEPSVEEEKDNDDGGEETPSEQNIR